MTFIHLIDIDVTPWRFITKRRIDNLMIIQCRIDVDVTSRRLNNVSLTSMQRHRQIDDVKNVMDPLGHHSCGAGNGRDKWKYISVYMDSANPLFLVRRLLTGTWRGCNIMTFIQRLIAVDVTPWRLYNVTSTSISRNDVYFILKCSSEINVYRKLIKMIFLLVKEYDIFTSEK